MLGLLVVVVCANAIPKSLTSLARLRGSPAAEQAARRFAGWSLVLGGLGYVSSRCCWRRPCRDASDRRRHPGRGT